MNKQDFINYINGVNNENVFTEVRYILKNDENNAITISFNEDLINQLCQIIDCKSVTRLATPVAPNLPDAVTAITFNQVGRFLDSLKITHNSVWCKFNLTVTKDAISEYHRYLLAIEKIFDDGLNKINHMARIGMRTHYDLFFDDIIKKKKFLSQFVKFKDYDDLAFRKRVKLNEFTGELQFMSVVNKNNKIGVRCDLDIFYVVINPEITNSNISSLLLEISNKFVSNNFADIVWS